MERHVRWGKKFINAILSNVATNHVSFIELVNQTRLTFFSILYNVEQRHKIVNKSGLERRQCSAGLFENKIPRNTFWLDLFIYLLDFYLLQSIHSGQLAKPTSNAVKLNQNVFCINPTTMFYKAWFVNYWVRWNKSKEAYSINLT